MAALALAWSAAGQQIQKQGKFWVETVSGSEPGAARLKVVSRGPVTVAGGASSNFGYTLAKKVRAGNERQARERLAQFALKTSRSGETVIFHVTHAEGVAELTIHAPRATSWVSVETHGGRVEAAGLDGFVETLTGGGAIRVDDIGGNVVARTAGGEISVGTIRGSLHCVSAGGTIRARSVGGEIACETAGGEIQIEQAQGPVRASTAGGSIRVAKAGAGVQADTAGGSIDVGSAAGMVRADTAGGSIDVGAATGVRCQSQAGGIRLALVSGSVRATTSVGPVVATLRNTGFSEGFLSTSAGDITVFIPSELAVTIRAQNAAVAQGVRRILSDFPEVSVRLDGGLVIGEGSINGGGPLLRLAGSGGTIYIKRQR